MDVLVRQGKVFYWGTRSGAPPRSCEAIGDRPRARAHPADDGAAAVQPASPRSRREGIRAALTKLGYGTTIWSPLACGLLTGKYNDGIPKGTRLDLPNYGWLEGDSCSTPESIAKVKTLEPIARDLGCTLAQLALAWCLKNPNVSTVITGATRMEQVVENFKALDLVEKLTPAVIEQIARAMA